MRTLHALLLSTALLLPVVTLAETNFRPSIKGVELGMTFDEMVAALAEQGFVQKADMLDRQGASVRVGNVHRRYAVVRKVQKSSETINWGFAADFEPEVLNPDAQGRGIVGVELAPAGTELRVSRIDYYMPLKVHTEPARVEAALRKASGFEEPTCDTWLTTYVVMKEAGHIRSDCLLADQIGSYPTGSAIDDLPIEPADVWYLREHEVLLDEDGLAEVYMVSLHSFEHSWPAIQAAKEGDEWEVPKPEFEVDL